MFTFVVRYNDRLWIEGLELLKQETLNCDSTKGVGTMYERMTCFVLSMEDEPKLTWEETLERRQRYYVSLLFYVLL